MKRTQRDPRGIPMKKKLRSNAGETLGETLVSLLIAVLALAILAGAIASSANMIKHSRSKLDSYYKENEKLVRMNGEGTSGTITISTGDSSLDLPDVAVEYYKNAALGNTDVVSYKAG